MCECGGQQFSADNNELCCAVLFWPNRSWIVCFGTSTSSPKEAKQPIRLLFASRPHDVVVGRVAVCHGCCSWTDCASSYSIACCCCRCCASLRWDAARREIKRIFVCSSPWSARWRRGPYWPGIHSGAGSTIASGLGPGSFNRPVPTKHQAPEFIAKPKVGRRRWDFPGCAWHRGAVPTTMVKWPSPPGRLPFPVWPLRRPGEIDFSTASYESS